MTFSFHPEAEQELNQAIDFYESITPGLGLDFAAEVFSAIQRAMDFPKAWSVLEGDIRRSLVRRFPYGILYSAEQEGIYILAVMHLHREPGYWKERK